MLKAIGFTDEDLAKPIIGVANTWTETMPCNYNLRELAVKVKEGIRAADGTPMEFNTIAISDGVTMGTEGMKASLVSREVIADSIELLVRGHMFDGVVALVACDKTTHKSVEVPLRFVGHFDADRDVLADDVRGADRIVVGDHFKLVAEQPGHLLVPVKGGQQQYVVAERRAKLQSAVSLLQGHTLLPVAEEPASNSKSA